MAKRKAEVILLCEDDQHESFAKRFLAGRGIPKAKIRVKKSPGPRGSAEQWVRHEFVNAVRTYRSRHVQHVVMVVIDGDRSSPAERIEQLDTACREDKLDPRHKDERIAVFVPRWHIETWIAYLGGASVDENVKYPKLDRPRTCQDAVDELIRMCDQCKLRSPAPPSLEAACEEYQSRLA
jgi:hypothetical protein